MIDARWTVGPPCSAARPPRDGSVGAGKRQHLGPFALREPAPDAVRLVHPQGVVAAGRHGRALEADRFGLGLSPGPGRSTLPLGVEEEGAGHSTTCRVQLPVPEICIRSGKAPGVRHVDPLFSSCRSCRRSTGPGIRAGSTEQRDRTRPRRPRAVGSACVVLSLGRIRADHDAVDLQTLEPSSVLDKTLITFFVDLEIDRVIVVGRRTSGARVEPGCEVCHDPVNGPEETHDEPRVMNRLPSVKSVEESRVTTWNRPSVSGHQPLGTHTDRPIALSTRPIGVSLIPPTDRGQVRCIPSAGGVS